MEERQSAPEFSAKNFSRAIAAPKKNLRFDFVGILRAARYAISLRLLSIQLVAFVPGYLLYIIFAYLGLLLSGRSLATAWRHSGLLPCLFAGNEPPSVFTVIVFGCGVAGLCATFLIANTAGSRLLWMKLRGNDAYSIRAAYDFAFDKFSAVSMAPLAVVVVIALFGSGGVLVGWFGRIPYLGQLVVTVFACLWMLASFLVLFMFVIAALAFVLTPAIVATTEENALEALFQIAGIVWRQPWRLLVYLFGVIATAIIALLIVAFCVKRAFIMMDALFATMMGNDYQNLSTQAQHLLQNWSVALGRLFSNYSTWTSPFYFSRPIAPLELSSWLDVLAHIFALSLMFSAFYVLAYPLAIINSGLTLTYLVLRRIKDGDNFLERYQADESTAP
jgi:hypothetical protein